MPISSNSRSSIWRSTPTTLCPRAARCALMSTTVGWIARPCRILHPTTMWSSQSVTMVPAYDATLAKAFDPFYTTKEAGSGTGLGLPMVQSFAAQSGGTTRIRSTLGEGTTVELWLPQASAPPRSGRRDRAGSKVDRGTANVLLCDDDDG